MVMMLLIMVIIKCTIYGGIFPTCGKCDEEEENFSCKDISAMLVSI